MASSNAEQDETRGDKHHEDEDDEEEENQSEGEEDGEDSPIKSAPSSPSKVSVHWPWALGMSPFFPYLGPVMPFGGFYPLREVQQPSAVAEGLTLNDGARNGAGNPFPIKLHNMLATCEREGLSDVVGFFVHGRAFAIHKVSLFMHSPRCSVVRFTHPIVATSLQFRSNAAFLQANQVGK